MKDRHLFYRRIERDLNSAEGIFVGNNYNVWMDIDKNSKISELLHMVFNYESGDVYGWPCDNITKEEVDRLWESGQRAFILEVGYKEVIIYDLKIITQDEYMSFMEKEKEVKKALITKLVEVVSDWSETEIKDSELQSIYKDIEGIINKKAMEMI